MDQILPWITAHGVQVVAIGWAVEKFLEVVSVLTPWKWDDNLGILLAKVLQNFSPKPVK